MLDDHYMPNAIKISAASNQALNPKSFLLFPQKLHQSITFGAMLFFVQQ